MLTPFKIYKMVILNKEGNLLSWYLIGVFIRFGLNPKLVKLEVFKRKIF
jgi:hypothetical protein